MPIKWREGEARLMVKSIYRQVLGRDPEVNVATGVVKYLVGGKTSVRILFTRMVRSDEFFDKRLRDKSPQEVATTIYQVILGRMPESVMAIQNAIDFVNGVGWRVQVDVMLNSEEYLEKFGDDRIPLTADSR